MTSTLILTDAELDADAAANALTRIADELTGSGFAAHSPVWDGSAYMKITNARGALCDVTITTYGTVTWDYRSCDGSHVDPCLITDSPWTCSTPATTRTLLSHPPCIARTSRSRAPSGAR